MELIIAKQSLILVLIMGIGMLCVKFGLVTQAFAKEGSRFIMTLAIPATVIKQLMHRPDAAYFKLMGIALVIAVGYHLLAIPLTNLMIPKSEKNTYWRESRFGIIYPNPLFFGLPIITAVFGPESGIFAIIFAFVVVIFSWTNGMTTLRGSFSFKKLLLNPGVVGAAVGVLLFIFEPPIPSVVDEVFNYIVSLNVPMVALITGMFVADMDLKRTFLDPKIYFAAAIRTVVLPLLTVGLLALPGVSGWANGAYVAVISSVISLACPTAPALTLMSAMTGRDTRYGTAVILISSVMSIGTLPLVVYAANLLIK